MVKRRIRGRASGLILSAALVLGLTPGWGMKSFAAEVSPEASVTVGGEVKEVSLAEAFGMVDNNGKVVLLKDVTVSEDEVLEVGETVDSFTLDLNGNALALEGK